MLGTRVGSSMSPRGHFTGSVYTVETSSLTSWGLGVTKSMPFLSWLLGDKWVFSLVTCSCYKEHVP